MKADPEGSSPDPPCPRALGQAFPSSPPTLGPKMSTCCFLGEQGPQQQLCDWSHFAKWTTISISQGLMWVGGDLLWELLSFYTNPDFS